MVSLTALYKKLYLKHCKTGNILGVYYGLEKSNQQLKIVYSKMSKIV
ncbi:ORF114 [Staphylococcus phage 53]|uniref:ORF114 n=1 Tax=Staphylococcus phage 53 TaxID=2908098 RepID=Q4ZDN3_9CAUD|nr:ORF114 [Staphylococcus phage 53]AAX90900.1 ORF114 [Staphylococcus phage 53]